MTAKVRLWRQRVKHHPVATVLISLSALLVVLVLLGGYKLNWGWTGFNGSNKSGKTLWDWMQLLFIPVVLAVAGFWFNHRERKAAELRTENERKAAGLRAEAEREIEQQRAEADREISFDNQREVALKEYIDKLSELMLRENLRKSKPDDEVRKIAHVLTLTVLPRLDEGRKRGVLQFLYESDLIDKDTSIIDLGGADLSKTNLSHVNLRRASLRGAILRQVTLGGANLSEANLSKSDLWGANFNGAIGGLIDLTTIGGPEFLVLDSYDGGIKADLRGADLSEAILYGSNATREQLNQAKSLKGATMPDGSRHP